MVPIINQGVNQDNPINTNNVYTVINEIPVNIIDPINAITVPII